VGSSISTDGRLDRGREEDAPALRLDFVLDGGGAVPRMKLENVMPRLCFASRRRSFSDADDLSASFSDSLAFECFVDLDLAIA
jgi:hypothetical protein